MTAILMSPSLPATTNDMAAARGGAKPDGARSTDASAETGGFSQVLDRQSHRHDSDVRQPGRESSDTAGKTRPSGKHGQRDDGHDEADASTTGLAAIALQLAQHTSALRQNQKETPSSLPDTMKGAVGGLPQDGSQADATEGARHGAHGAMLRAEAETRRFALPAQAAPQDETSLPRAAQLADGAADTDVAGPASRRPEAVPTGGIARRSAAQTDGASLARRAASVPASAPGSGNPFTSPQADAIAPKDVATMAVHASLSGNAGSASLSADPSLAGLSASNVSGLGQAPAGPTAGPSVGVPLNSPAWAPEFGRQFVSLVKGGHDMPHTAELRLDPPELGPLRILIQLSDNVAHAVFVSPHGSVRHTVEQALPQLQQALEQAGISLGQTSVNDQGQPGQAFDGPQTGSRPAGGSRASDPGGDAILVAEATTRRAPAPDALVDTFA